MPPANKKSFWLYFGVTWVSEGIMLLVSGGCFDRSGARGSVSTGEPVQDTV